MGRLLKRTILRPLLGPLAKMLSPERVLLDARTGFNHLRVIDRRGIRYLVFVDDSPNPVSNKPEQSTRA